MSFSFCSSYTPNAQPYTKQTEQMNNRFSKAADWMSKNENDAASIWVIVSENWLLWKSWGPFSTRRKQIEDAKYVSKDPCARAKEWFIEMKINLLNSKRKHNEKWDSISWEKELRLRSKLVLLWKTNIFCFEQSNFKIFCDSSPGTAAKFLNLWIRPQT